MENMIKQMRVRFSGNEEGNEGETSRARDRKLPSQTTGSFKGDNRRRRNWYRGQSSREVSYDYDSEYMESDEFQTAVAAAAFAINSVEKRRRRTRQRREDSMIKSKRKPEDGVVSVTRRARGRMFSSSPSNKMKNKEDATVPISTPTLLSKKSPAKELRERVPSRATYPANTELEDEAPRETVSSPFDKKTSSTSFDWQSDKRKPESGLASTSQQPTTPPASPATEVDRKRSEPRIEDIKADVWEKTEMERIQER